MDLLSSLDPALPLAPWSPRLSPLEALGARVECLLSTRPGTLPWEPEFGCDLDDLVGAPATTQRLHDARWRIQQAIARWLPDLRVARCEVVAVSQEDGSPGAPRQMPLAEGALMALGVRAALEIDLDIETPAGPITVQAFVQP